MIMVCHALTSDNLRYRVDSNRTPVTTQLSTGRTYRSAALEDSGGDRPSAEGSRNLPVSPPPHVLSHS